MATATEICHQPTKNKANVKRRKSQSHFLVLIMFKERGSKSKKDFPLKGFHVNSLGKVVNIKIKLS